MSAQDWLGAALIGVPVLGILITGFVLDAEATLFVLGAMIVALALSLSIVSGLYLVGLR